MQESGIIIRDILEMLSQSFESVLVNIEQSVNDDHHDTLQPRLPAAAIVGMGSPEMAWMQPFILYLLLQHPHSCHWPNGALSRIIHCFQRILTLNLAENTPSGNTATFASSAQLLQCRVLAGVAHIAKSMKERLPESVCADLPLITLHMIQRNEGRFKKVLLRQHEPS